MTNDLEMIFGEDFQNAPDSLKQLFNQLDDASTSFLGLVGRLGQETQKSLTQPGGQSGQDPSVTQTMAENERSYAAAHKPAKAFDKAPKYTPPRKPKAQKPGALANPQSGEDKGRTHSAASLPANETKRRRRGKK